MKKHIVVIDTNALISFVTDRNPEQQVKIAELFEKAANLRYLVLCPQNVLTEFVYVLERVYGVSKSLIKTMLISFIEMPGIEVVHEIDLKILFSLWPKKMSDYGDAIVASVCKARVGSAIVTFDRKFKTALKRHNIPVYSI